MAGNKSVFNWQLYLGFVLVVTGGLFLADQLLGLQIMRFYWPLLIVLLGLTFFIGMILAGKKGAGLAIPGAIITTTGLLLFVQNTFDLWVTWAYAWALLISAAGLGLLIMNFYLTRTSLRRVAGLIIGIGLTLFVLFGVLFEIILNIAGTDVNSGVFLGAGLVLLGFFILFSRPLFAKNSHNEAASEPESGDAVDATFRTVEDIPQPGEEAVRPLGDSADFKGLHFKSVGEVFILQGEVCSLKMEGSEDLLKKVTTEVQDGILSITYKSDVADWTGLQWISEEHRLRYYITLKDLTYLKLAGAGSIHAERLSGESLAVSHPGAGSMNLKDVHYQTLDVDLGGLGEITLSGKVQSQNVDLSGAGSYQAQNLNSQTANISLSGAGSARLWVESDLNADISGAGSIKYKGDPKLQQTKTGLGSIKRL